MVLRFRTGFDIFGQSHLCFEVCILKLQLTAVVNWKGFTMVLFCLLIELMTYMMIEMSIFTSLGFLSFFFRTCLFIESWNHWCPVPLVYLFIYTLTFSFNSQKPKLETKCCFTYRRITYSQIKSVDKIPWISLFTGLIHPLGCCISVYISSFQFIIATHFPAIASNMCP